MTAMTHWLAVGRSSQTPYFVIRGAKPGPTCIVTAGIHGTERAGVLAAHRLLLNASLTNGTLIIVPLVNVRAFHQRKRGRPDLNRTFPRRLGDSARNPLAAELVRLARRHRARWCIDLHEAMGFSRLNKKALGQTLICYPEHSTVSMATRVVKRINFSIRNTSQHFTVSQTVLSGSFRTALARVLGCRAITVETSMNLRLPTRVKYQERIVRELLREIGIL